LQNGLATEWVGRFDNGESISGGFMRGVMLFAAGPFAGLAIQAVMAQNGGGGVAMMNHVGISVPNIAEAVAYYERKMGNREAFRVNDQKGQPRLVYMQVSKNTFLDLNPATVDRPAGFTHCGLQVENAAQAVARFRKSGVTVSDPNTSDTKATDTKAIAAKAIGANITDPYMGRIELAELTPESLHYKAIQNWK
jgi:catechol 2,3-dioxygenase-like lactoylglutathione lyase family enzyme